MKTNIFTILLCCILLLSFQSPDNTGSVNKTALSDRCMKLLSPYSYDSQKFTKIALQKQSQTLELEVPVFIGEKYRIVFNTSTVLKKMVKINVYNKSKTSKNRTPIYTNVGEINKDEIVFDVPRVKNLYVEYDIPATDAAIEQANGYVLFMIGYR